MDRRRALLKRHLTLPGVIFQPRRRVMQMRTQRVHLTDMLQFKALQHRDNTRYVLLRLIERAEIRIGQRECAQRLLHALAEPA